MFVCLCPFWRGGENWIKPHCACISCFKSSSFCLWTAGLIPKFGCHEKNCNKIYVGVVLWGVDHEFSEHTPMNLIALYGNTLFSFLKNLYLFPQWLTFILTRRITLGGGGNISISSTHTQTSVSATCLDCHADGPELESQCSWILHFFNS